MRTERRVPVPRRSHPAVSTASCGRGARLPLPKTPERAILRPTTTGNPGNVGEEDRPRRPGACMRRLPMVPGGA
jgi:hypothetical protein